MNRMNSARSLSAKAAEARRTPRRWRVGHSRAHFRQVLECAGPAALWIAQTGSWSQCARRSERGRSMNRTNSEYALPSKAAEDRRTPRRYRVGDSRAHFRQVLECAGPAALWIAQTGSWSQCMRKSERGLSMNLGWVGVPASGGSEAVDRLKLGLQAVNLNHSAEQCIQLSD